MAIHPCASTLASMQKELHEQCKVASFAFRGPAVIFNGFMAPTQASPVRKSAPETAAPHLASYLTFGPEAEQTGHILTTFVQYPAQRRFSPQPK